MGSDWCEVEESAVESESTEMRGTVSEEAGLADGGEMTAPDRSRPMAGEEVAMARGGARGAGDGRWEERFC